MSINELLRDRNFLHIVEIVLSVIGIVFILLQNRGESGNNFIGGGEAYTIRRDLHVFLLYGTIAVITLLTLVIYFDIRV